MPLVNLRFKKLLRSFKKLLQRFNFLTLRNNFLKQHINLLFLDFSIVKEKEEATKLN